jgi:predicted nucleotide-binding protein
LSGKWESTIGTAGAFVACRDTAIDKARTRRVFIVHGHDGELKQAVARFLERLGLEPVILHEQPNLGRTLIEKFETSADADYAVILLTPDDIGYPANQEGQAKPRARQNVILELGYFVGRFGRSKVCALHKGDAEIPSDLHGVVYVPVDPADGWKLKLGAELKHSGMDIDLNRLL